MSNHGTRKWLLTRRTFLFVPAALAGLSGRPARQTPPKPGQRVLELERRLRGEFRRIRLAHGLAAFQPEPTLAEIARRHAEDMLRRRYFDHQSPDGQDMAQRVSRGHRRLIGLAGENLWKGSGFSTSDLEALSARIGDSLMKSPGHRENILRPNYTHMDVGAKIEGEEVRVVQLFAEIDGYLKTALPTRLRSGQKADLTVQLAAGQREAARYDLFSLKDRRLVAEPVTLDQPIPHADPGEYSMRFYFRTFRERQLRIVYGPSFWLER